MSSPKLNFMSRSEEDLEQEQFEELIRIERSEYKPNEIGTRLHLSLARKKLNVGGLGSGKTRTMGEHINNMLLAYPGGKGVLARKDLGDLKRTTQAEYLENIVAPETVDRFNINDNALYYKNGSILFFMETKTPSNFKSMEIIVYGVDEADENEEGKGKDRLMTILDGRLRQKIKVNGNLVPVPYCGIWTYNPTTDDHWLAGLEDKPEYNMEVFRSSTYDNQENLPVDYIPSLMGSLAPWEVASLVFGKRASNPKGKPVIHGFSIQNNVRPLRVFHHLKLVRAWDFGFNHPCVGLYQYDPEFNRMMKLREVIGEKELLKFFAPKVKEATRALVGPAFPIYDVCDPHGADQKDVAESSVEHLRIHHDVYCNFKRQRIKTGLDQIQTMVVEDAPFRDWEWVPGMETGTERRFLVDPSCKLTISAYLGGYYRDDEGNPVKDDLHDHPVDTDRYGTVFTMGDGLARQRKANQKRYLPQNRITGY